MKNYMFLLFVILFSGTFVFAEDGLGSFIKKIDTIKNFNSWYGYEINEDDGIKKKIEFILTAEGCISVYYEDVFVNGVHRSRKCLHYYKSNKQILKTIEFEDDSVCLMRRFSKSGLVVESRTTKFDSKVLYCDKIKNVIMKSDFILKYNEITKDEMLDLEEITFYQNGMIVRIEYVPRQCSDIILYRKAFKDKALVAEEELYKTGGEFRKVSLEDQFVKENPE